MTEEESPGTLRRAYRTVTPGYKPRPNTEMNSLGWAMFLVMVALLVPLLPFAVAVWAVAKLLDYLAGRNGGTTE
ncbi:hypothetical protein C499_14765 [Halogeometricum borinquense DSM 11551]|uniref:Uncharacterized protein n=1 Tax=Halogeometricum borinquense (strain ATCC 700274 / DSM 11551 / JCM 10706 / KCTC 4070 / PR3) TaxID=469382 RepID=E4NTY1_HALBP|nr:hypothetical protein [Halogeometricum borinquense]ADQ68286.1 hypothetical protein Hbor_27420 [Halogeometricum borinquense DSM 11551]ELY24672.1 hypothetical protein C499_14765 [Halogeometricum borinquense DSM 11551]